MNEDKSDNTERPAARGEPRSEPPESVEKKVGTHPLGTATGAVGGAVIGAVAGMAAGPVGSLVGAVGGAVSGGVLGGSTGSGPVVDISAQESYWREHYASRPYVASGAPYEDYAPAYRYGARTYAQLPASRQWEEVESDMAAGWESARETSRLGWTDAMPAVRDAWNRMRGDTDVDPDEVGVSSPS